MTPFDGSTQRIQIRAMSPLLHECGLHVPLVPPVLTTLSVHMLGGLCAVVVSHILLLRGYSVHCCCGW